MDVALVGREQAGDENLSLRYLAAALVRAGHRAHLVPLCGPPDLTRAADDVARVKPALVGLSIPDADVAMDLLAFVRLLRRRGYGGHLTCGGPLATLARGEILARQPGIDSVVRQAGEAPLVEMADRLAAGRGVDDVPGVSTRRGDGLPAGVASAGDLHLRPLRPARLPRFLGVPTARLLASRGCPGRCPYCGPAALQEEAVREGLAAGFEPEALARHGVGGVRRREPDDVAEEVAELYHDRGARFFVLLDDNLLAGEPAAAAAWLGALRAGLRRRRVGRTAWSLQVEARTVTDDVARELEELGAVRTLVGTEALTAGGLARLRRPADPGFGTAAVERLRRTGAVVSLNSIVVHPGADAETIRGEIEALSALRGVHFDALAMAVHPGTRAWRELWHAGELSGGTYAWRHEIRDPAVARFRALLVRMRLSGLGPYGPNVLAHDVAVNAALGRRLGLDPRAEAHAAALGGIVDGMNERRIAALRAALALAESPGGDRVAAERSLVRRFEREMAPFVVRLERFQSELEREVRVVDRPRGLFFRSALAASFVLLGGSAACWNSHDTDGGEAGETGEADVGPADHAAEAEAEAEDGGSDVVEATDGGCDDWNVVVEQANRAREIPGDAGCPCDREADGGDWQSYGLVTDSTGRVIDVCAAFGGDTVPDDVRSCYLEALAGETFPCFADEECWAICYVTLM